MKDCWRIKLVAGVKYISLASRLRDLLMAIISSVPSRRLMRTEQANDIKDESTSRKPSNGARV